MVIQPESFGGYVNPYFTHLNPYLYFNGLQNSKKLIAEYNLEKKVLVSTTMQWTFTSKWPQNIQIENLIAIAGGVFGIATSVLLFNTMNFLYFEEFRNKSS